MRPPPANRESSLGFTLIEMLVVFAVFAFIGVVSSQIVTRVLANQQTLTEREERLAAVERAMFMIQRDILQISSRSIRDQLGDPLPALIIDADGQIEFTRFGWRNPLMQSRSELQRVSYLAEDGVLYRIYWPVLDRAPGVEPKRQKLLDEVESIEFMALDRSGDEYTFWPQVQQGESIDPARKLAAVLVRIETPPFGQIERLWPVPVI
jgi:general secretion pathway protein J